MSNDDHHESGGDFVDRCVDAWLRLERAVTDVTLGVKISAAAVVLGFGLWLANALFELTPWEVLYIAALLTLMGLLVFGATSLTPTKGTVAIAVSQGGDSDAGSDANPTRAPAGGRCVSSRKWLPSWPWRAVLRNEQIEVLSPVRPPLVIPLKSVAKIQLWSGGDGYCEALALLDKGGTIIGTLSQPSFTEDFLEALSETTACDIEYLWSGYLGGC